MIKEYNTSIQTLSNFKTKFQKIKEPNSQKLNQPCNIRDTISQL